jgi:hypothetical protein
MDVTETGRVEAGVHSTETGREINPTAKSFPREPQVLEGSDDVPDVDNDRIPFSANERTGRRWSPAIGTARGMDVAKPSPGPVRDLKERENFGSGGTPGGGPPVVVPVTERDLDRGSVLPCFGATVSRRVG